MCAHECRVPLHRSEQAGPVFLYEQRDHFFDFTHAHLLGRQGLQPSQFIGTNARHCCAIANMATLITANVKHFGAVEGLDFEAFEP
jgi:hypothetical protein